MLGAIVKSSTAIVTNGLRSFATSTQNNFKVAVLGGAGGIGQPLALLLKHSPLISRLAVYDVAPFTLGVAKDLSHIDTEGKVKGYTGPDELDKCLQDSSLVIVPAGMPRKPGMSRDDLFDINASIAMHLADACARNCPNAVLGIITNPVNSTVPIVTEVYKARGVYRPEKIFGVTTLDVVRANVFLSDAKGLDIMKTNVPVIGGHSGVTILPLLSQAVPQITLSNTELITLTKQIQEAGTEVVIAKAGAGSATLSMAYAGARFGLSVLQAMNGEKGVIECAYVASDMEHVPYFARPILLGPDGAEANLGLGVLSDFEKSKLQYEVLPELKKDIAKGLEFVKNRITIGELSK